jgi:type I restriction enzyme, S subunit
LSFVADLSALVAASTDPRHCCPDGWTRVPLGSVAKIINGFPFKSGGFGAVGHPVIRIRDVARGFTNTHFDGAAPDGYWVEAGELVVGMDGDFQTAFWRSDRALLNQRVCKIVPDENRIDRRFLAYILPGYLELINANTPSVTVKHLSSRTLASIPVPLPSLDRQVRIADRIDELSVEIDDGEAALARARNDLATWRKALLKAAVAGELTADWRAANPTTETGAELLARILADRRANWSADFRNEGKRYADAAEPMLGELPDRPANWAWVGIEQLTTGGIRNGLSLKEAAEPTAVKGLKLDALQPNGIDWSRARYLPIDLDRAAPYLLRTGDLLISRANGSPEFVGRCTMVDEGRDATVFPDTAIRYPIVNEPRIRAWARLAWSAPQSRKRMLALAKSTAGILKISQGDIAAVALPLPPLAEIDEIVTRVERLTAEAEAGADDLIAMKSLPATLRQSILAAAFRGELA